jgi:hypothetical protein
MTCMYIYIYTMQDNAQFMSDLKVTLAHTKPVFDLYRNKVVAWINANLFETLLNKKENRK